MWLSKNFKDYTRATEFAKRKEQMGCLTVLIFTLNGYCVDWKVPRKLWGE